MRRARQSHTAATRLPRDCGMRAYLRHNAKHRPAVGLGEGIVAGAQLQPRERIPDVVTEDRHHDQRSHRHDEPFRQPPASERKEGKHCTQEGGRRTCAVDTRFGQSDLRAERSIRGGNYCRLLFTDLRAPIIQSSGQTCLAVPRSRGSARSHRSIAWPYYPSPLGGGHPICVAPL